MLSLAILVGIMARVCYLQAPGRELPPTLTTTDVPTNAASLVADASPGAHARAFKPLTVGPKPNVYVLQTATRAVASIDYVFVARRERVLLTETSKTTDGYIVEYIDWCIAIVTIVTNIWFWFDSILIATLVFVVRRLCRVRCVRFCVDTSSSSKSAHDAEVSTLPGGAEYAEEAATLFYDAEDIEVVAILEETATSAEEVEDSVKEIATPAEAGNLPGVSWAHFSAEQRLHYLPTSVLERFEGRQPCILVATPVEEAVVLVEKVGKLAEDVGTPAEEPGAPVEAVSLPSTSWTHLSAEQRLNYSRTGTLEGVEIRQPGMSRSARRRTNKFEVEQGIRPPGLRPEEMRDLIAANPELKVTKRHHRGHRRRRGLGAGAVVVEEEDDKENISSA